MFQILLVGILEILEDFQDERVTYKLYKIISGVRKLSSHGVLVGT